MFARRPARTLRASFRGGALLDLDLADPIQARAFLTRDYDPRLLRFLERRLSSGGVFVDVGAHVGLVSLSVAARCIRSGVDVHAFEPDPSNSDRFAQNLRLNPELPVTLNRAAVGDRVGSVMFRRSISDRALGEVVDETDVSGQSVVSVPVTTLDHYLRSRAIDRVALLKIDAEGYEPAVLRGAEVSLRQHRVDCIVTEINPEQLQSHGWSAETIHDELERHSYRQVPIPAVGLRRWIRRTSGPVHDVAFVRPRITESTPPDQAG